MSSQILEKIASSGVSGIKRADLKKSFGKDCDDALDELSREEKVVVDHKGVAYFVWTRDNYLSHLSQNDPKYKLILNHFKKIENSIAEVKERTNNLSKKITGDPNSDDGPEFKTEFEKYLKELATSLGWIPFSNIREKVCKSMGVSPEKFYSLASALVESDRGKYEISTGGQEGILTRGLVHGYVRLL